MEARIKNNDDPRFFDFKVRNQHASITVLEILPCDRPPVAIIASGLSHAQINHFDLDSNCIFPIDPINCALARSQKHNKTNQE